MQVNRSYHIEGNHISERYITSLMPLYQLLVYQNGAAACGQAQDKGPLRRGLESCDALLCLAVSLELRLMYISTRGGMRTNYIVRNVLRCKSCVVSDD
jgi:hypothetical protein